ncbi:hypothetical protein GQ53DRAFT_837728 [Thozetella sp. PMI_491]|nr:hypothetical protein GQ53DRAFT_837728 [Thozetella sp. PMI_491]
MLPDQLFTPRLRLKRELTTSLGSLDLECHHRVWTSPEATQWSLRGPCISKEDTQAWMAGVVPSPDVEGSEHRIAYAVLCRTDQQSGTESTTNEVASEFRDSNMDPEQESRDCIGIVTFLPSTPCTDEIKAAISSSPGPTRLLELGYLFLPSSWGQGFATESVKELFRAYREHLTQSDSNEKVFILARAHAENTASIRVMKKMGFKDFGTIETPEKIFIGGAERKHAVANFLLEI